MSEYAQSILAECHYSDLLKATFNFSNFDIMVNGEDKGTSHGKGYRSYLNTVMILMLRKYLANFAKFDPHTFIIDTPLHGFDDGVAEDMPESMRAGLYRYFMNHQDEGQLIIIIFQISITKAVERPLPRSRKSMSRVNGMDS